ncbi:MAG TPA: protein-glutamate O-methyltransferase CheR [Longimicrobiales bacterium]|nr:protein-glutamate O-methyltransferase CheR [Longimicrobiales bacterium]
MKAGWSTAGFAEVAELVRERTGLVFPDSRLLDVEAAIRRAMARLGAEGTDELLELLRDDARARDAFVSELTIGESYFQRDPSQFDLLRWRILPELLRSRPPDRPMRVWSAGCATGEEPYTVAMLFEELDAAERSDIVGTDIARQRLADAQRGLYSKWQLRNTPEPVRRRYFAPHGRFFELSPRIRQRVDFRYLNLAEDSFPSLTTGIWGMDVILCRNVLIYFDAPTVERVARRLIASLSEDGWLLLGASDPAISEMVDCDVVLTDSGLAYRRRGAAGAEDFRTASGDTRGAGLRTWIGQNEAAPTAEDAGIAADRDNATLTGHDHATSAGVHHTTSAGDDHETSAGDDHEASIRHGHGEFTDLPAADEVDIETNHRTETGAPPPANADAAILDAYERRAFDRVQALAESAASAGSMSRAAWTAWVRAQANEGHLAEAAETVTRAIDRIGAAPELLYLHAVLLLQAGHSGDAAAAARRALYMDRSLVVAHLTLAEAQRRMGNVDGARRALRNAALLLGSLKPADVVPASDGETAGRLGELVRVKLSLLEGAS